MPMTLAHPAAVLPLRGTGLPLVALVVGSMVPDIPVFLGEWGAYGVTHSVTGLLTVDLVIGVVFVALWFLVARDALVDLAPGPIRARLAPSVRPARIAVLLTPIALVVGGATHVLWDSFTHGFTWGPEHIAWLRETHGPLPGYKWAQYISGVVGLSVVMVAVARELMRREPLAPDRPARRLPAWPLPAATVVALGVGLAAVVDRRHDGFHAMAFDGVVESILAAAVVGPLVCLAWHLRRVV